MDTTETLIANDATAELLLARDHFLKHRKETADLYELTMRLYGSWYARPQGPLEIPNELPVDLVQVFRAADETGRSWSDGWTTEQVASDGRVIARRGAEVRMADLTAYVAPESLGVRPRVGDPLRLADRRDRVEDNGAWWKTGGRSWRFTRATTGLVRVYWNLALECLPEVVHRVTHTLSDNPYRWMLKCAVEVEVHARSDATVLYLDWDAVRDVAPEIDRIAFDLASQARPGAPPLTLPIHPGVAVAVDPGPDQSFGESRCRLIAEALLSLPAEERDAALVAMRDRLAREGIDYRRPYARQSDPLLPWEK
jgi:hypothetical protein